MARKRTAEAPPEEIGTIPADMAAAPPETTPSPGDAPLSDTNGNAERRPAKVFTYLIQRDTYVQVSVWERLVPLRNGGSSFVTYDLSLRKRYRQNGDWKTLYSFSASEVYAVVHAFNQATAWVTQMRAAEEAGCPF